MYNVGKKSLVGRWADSYGMYAKMFLMGTDTKTTPPQFIEWLDAELKKTNLSDSEASRRAGLSHVAIYDIRSGLRPGIKKCKALARLFGTPAEYVLRLAGYLEPLPISDAVTEETRYKIGKIAEIMNHLPPDIQAETLDHMIAVLQIVHRAGQDQGEKEKEPSDKR